MAQHDSMITPVVMLVAQFSTCIPTRSPESPPRAGPGRAQLLGSLVDSESEAPTPSLESDDPTQSAARMSRWHCHGASRRRESRSPRAMLMSESLALALGSWLLTCLGI
jgi:hypothetical protein